MHEESNIHLSPVMKNFTEAEVKEMEVIDFVGMIKEDENDGSFGNRHGELKFNSNFKDKIFFCDFDLIYFHKLIVILFKRPL